MSDGPEDQGAAGGILAIVLLGAALGVGYNQLGLSSKPSWGLAWIGEDRLAAMPSLDDLGQPAVAAGAPAYGMSDDPMAIGQATEGLPSIPELDRPIEAGLSAVRSFVDARAALIIDAREPEEFAAGRLPGAINIPYDEADPERLERIEAAGRPIIVYCGGGTCELSMDLAYDLIYAGHRRVLVYMGGFPEWSAAGYTIETAAGG